MLIKLYQLKEKFIKEKNLLTARQNPNAVIIQTFFEFEDHLNKMIFLYEKIKEIREKNNGNRNHH